VWVSGVQVRNTANKNIFAGYNFARSRYSINTHLSVILCNFIASLSNEHIHSIEIIHLKLAFNVNQLFGISEIFFKINFVKYVYRARVLSESNIYYLENENIKEGYLTKRVCPKGVSNIISQVRNALLVSYFVRSN